MHTLELCCYLFLKDVRLHQESGLAQLCDGTTHDDGIPLGGAS